MEIALIYGSAVTLAAALLLAGFVAGTHTSSSRIRVMETNLSLEAARAMSAERLRAQWQELAMTTLTDLRAETVKSNELSLAAKMVAESNQEDILKMHRQLESAGHYRGRTEGEQLTPGWQAADRRDSPAPRPPSSFGAPT